jgi:hypothetical protein
MSLLPSGWVPEKPFELEIENLQTDVLSARCVADRLRLRTAIVKVADATPAEVLTKMLHDLQVVLEYISKVEQVKRGRLDVAR